MLYSALLKLLPPSLLQTFTAETEKTSSKLSLTMIFLELVSIELKKVRDHSALLQPGLLSTGELSLEMEESLMELKKKVMEDQ